MASVTERGCVGLFAGAEPLLARLGGFEWNGIELAFGFVASVAEGLVFGLAAGTPEIGFSGFNLDRHRRFACDVTLHSGSPF